MARVRLSWLEIEPESRRCAALRLLQFLPRPFQFEGYSCHGSGPDGSCMDYRGDVAL